MIIGDATRCAEAQVTLAVPRQQIAITVAKDLAAQGWVELYCDQLEDCPNGVAYADDTSPSPPSTWTPSPPAPWSPRCGGALRRSAAPPILRLMKRPSPALVIATVALVFSLTGTGWAVTQLPRNSVGTSQLKQNAVTGSKIKNGTIESGDLSSTARGALRGATGPQGPAGPQGATGPQGASGIVAQVPGMVRGSGSGEFYPPTGNPTVVTTGPLTTTSAGPVFAFGRGVFETQNGDVCTGAAGPKVALYVGDVAVENSGLQFPEYASGSNNRHTISIFGVTPVLAAGTHRVRMVVGCSDNSTPNFSNFIVKASLGAIGITAEG